MYDLTMVQAAGWLDIEGGQEIATRHVRETKGREVRILGDDEAEELSGEPNWKGLRSKEARSESDGGGRPRGGGGGEVASQALLDALGSARESEQGLLSAGAGCTEGRRTGRLGFHAL